MSYLDVYFSRINHFGETTSERARNQGIRSFERWLQESPHTVENLSVERGIYFSGIILTHKDRDEKKLLKLNVANDIPLQVGDILNWRQDNGEIEKWILLSEEKKVNGNHRSFENEEQKSKYIDLLKLELKLLSNINLEKSAKCIYENKYNRPDSSMALRSLDYKQLEFFAKKYVD